jgi:NAD(P)-dependent dehydrogenase (short-subunit alcohol dehydrogenase family)
MLLLGGLYAFSRLWKRLRRPDLGGQVALVTGGSRGLGLLLARELGRAGCRVAICARDVDELARAQDDLRRWGVDRVFTIQCDVTDEAEVRSRVQVEVGPSDILVNNAGVIQTGPIQSQTMDDFRQAIDIMLWGGLHTTAVLLTQMIARDQGHIVNITSVGGKVAVPHLLPYGVAKFGMTG